MPADLILALDQGTTSSRAILFDPSGRPVATAQRELQQFYPRGRLGRARSRAHLVGHDCRRPCRNCEVGPLGQSQIAAIGITNQRETAIVWDRATGRPIHNAIVWQDRRTAPFCRELVAEGLEAHVKETTGLLIDAYFSATKIKLAARQRCRRAGHGPSAASWRAAPSTASCSGA